MLCECVIFEILDFASLGQLAWLVESEPWLLMVCGGDGALCEGNRVLRRERSGDVKSGGVRLTAGWGVLFH